MKVRLEENIIRYRISTDELAKLKTNGYLCNFTRLPNGGLLRYKINAEENRTAFETERDEKGDKLVLYLPLETLESYKPSKQGMEIPCTLPNDEMLTVIFEVDISKKKG